jgi:FkbM family methyltransferase
MHFRLDISKQLDHAIYFSTVKDAAWQNLFQVIRPGFNIIDVGANIGFLTLNFARLASKGMVYSFEPDSETFSKLRKNVSLNDFRNVRLSRIALGSRAGTGELYKMYESNPGANRILSAKPVSPVRSELVEITTLDHLDSRESFREIDLIKVDVEGYELFVLQGGYRLIKRCKPILFVELVDQNLKVHRCSSASVLQYLAQFDYLILDARTMKPLADSDAYYTDIFCFPGGKSPGYD